MARGSSGNLSKPTTRNSKKTLFFLVWKEPDNFATWVSTLRTQHQAGRRLTDSIQKLSTAAGLKELATRQQLTGALQSFVRMYRPHAAREDTVVFPAFHKIVSPSEYAALGEQFEDKEHELFGKDGFEKILVDVEQIEKRLGMEDLNQFTPA